MQGGHNKQLTAVTYRI